MRTEDSVMFSLSYVIKKKEYHVGNGYTMSELKGLAEQVADALKEIHCCRKITFWICEGDRVIEEFIL